MGINARSVHLLHQIQCVRMTRGHQKIQAQQKAAAKAAKSKKSGHDQKAAARKALVFTCTVCKVKDILDSTFAHGNAKLLCFSTLYCL